MLQLILFLCALNAALGAMRNVMRPLRSVWRVKPRLSTLVVLGSGGHTSEMMAMMSHLSQDKYAPRSYVVARTDSMSERKVRAHEDAARGVVGDGDASVPPPYVVLRVGRAREVGQSWLSSAWTTALAFVDAMRIVFSVKPDVIMCNGPGTCVPVVFAGLVMRAFGREAPALVFVESACRTRRLSLTGKIFYHLRVVDTMCVMWESLIEKYPRCTFVGRVM
jgi:beta-1,4-N-acetylglucosaminyltransferase